MGSAPRGHRRERTDYPGYHYGGPRSAQVGAPFLRTRPAKQSMAPTHARRFTACARRIGVDPLCTCTDNGTGNGDDGMRAAKKHVAAIHAARMVPASLSIGMRHRELRRSTSRNACAWGSTAVLDARRLGPYACSSSGCRPTSGRAPRAGAAVSAVKRRSLYARGTTGCGNRRSASALATSASNANGSHGLARE